MGKGAFLGKDIGLVGLTSDRSDLIDFVHQQTSCLDLGARPLPAPTPPGVLTGVPPPPRRANDLDLGTIQSKIPSCNLLTNSIKYEK